MQKQIQFIVFFFRTFIERFKQYLTLGFLIGFFSTLLFIQIYPVYIEIFGQKHVKVGLVGKYSESKLPLSIQRKLSPGLISLTSSGEATSSLAKKWEVSQDGKEYTFHLLDNIFWHDGKKFKASDVNYKLKGAAFTALDNLTLKVSLKEPYAPLLILMSYPLVKPRLTGLGLYKLKKIVTNKGIVSKISLQTSKKSLPNLTYRFYPNTAAAILAFKMGKVDKLENMQDIHDLKNWSNIKISEITLYDRFVGIFFNLTNQLFKEKEVRQALAYAIPKFKNFERAHTPISPLSWAYSQKIRLYNYDPDAAKKILSDSPLASDSAKITLSTFAPFLKQAETITNAWNTLGLNTKVKVENSFIGDYQLFLAAQAIPPDPDQYLFWQSTQDATNITHYDNPKIDKLLEDGRKTYNIEERKKIYTDFQRYLVDDAPVIFLYYPKVYVVERK